MRLLPIAVFGLAGCCCAFGQTYTRVIVAGGGLPENAPGLSISLGSVSGVAVDGSGNVFIALPDYSIVARMDAVTGTLTTVAGNGTAGYGGDNGSATTAQLYSPYGLAFDPDGNLYISDLAGVVREVSDGIITTVAGLGCGPSGANLGDGGPAICATLSNPRGIAVDANFNLFIADAGNMRIREVSNGIITTVAGDGTLGTPCLTPQGLCVVPTDLGDGGPATSGHLYFPYGVAVDARGDLFIADTFNGCLRIVSGGIIDTFECAYAPYAVAIDSGGRLYLTWSGIVFELVNGALTPVPGEPPLRLLNGSIPGPLGIAVDANGAIYIADSEKMLVRKASNGTITTVAGNGGAGGYGGDGGSSINSLLNQPRGVAVDSAGNLYFSDSGNHAVRKVAGGVITTVAGNGTPGFTGDGGPATSAQLHSPSGIAVDGAGNLYIADTFNNVVREVANGVIKTIAGTGVSGNTGDNGPATKAQLGSPSVVAVDGAGNLYVVSNYVTYTGGACYGTAPFPVVCTLPQPLELGEIRKISNGVITSLGSGADIGVMAADSAGNLYISDTIFGATISHSIVFLGAGSVFGESRVTTVPGTSGLLGPGGVSLDQSGAIWIADTGNHRILKVSNGIATTITTTDLSSPQAIAMDASGNVYFSDAVTNRIWALIPSAQ